MKAKSEVATRSGYGCNVDPFGQLLTRRPSAEVVPGPMRVSIAFVLLAATCTISTTQGQESSGADQRPLEMLQSALSTFSTLDLRALAMSTRYDAKGAQVSVQESRIAVVRNQSRARISIKRQFKRTGKEFSRSQNDYITLEDGSILNVQSGLDAALEQIDGQDHNFGLLYYNKELSGQPQDYDPSSIYAILDNAAIVVWNLGLSTIQDQVRASQATKVSQNAKEWEISARGRFGELQLSLSAESGWLPTRFRLTKNSEDDALGGKNVTQAYGAEVTRVVWAGSASGFQKDQEGRWRPALIDIVNEVYSRQALLRRTVTRCVLEEVAFDPPLSDGDFEPRVRVPEGTKVTIDGATQLPYIWDGRGVVPGAPELPEFDQAIEASELVAGASSRGLLIVLNIIVVAVLSYLWWQRWRLAG